MDTAEYEAVLGWPSASAPIFEAFHGDMYLHDWHTADMVFCNSTCFNLRMMEKIYEQSLKCNRGTWFVTMSKKLPNAERVRKGTEPRSDLHWEFILAIKL